MGTAFAVSSFIGSTLLSSNNHESHILTTQRSGWPLPTPGHGTYQWWGGCQMNWVMDQDPGTKITFGYFWNSGTEYEKPIVFTQTKNIPSQSNGMFWMWQQQRFDYDGVWKICGTGKNAGTDIYIVIVPHYTDHFPAYVFDSFQLWYTFCPSNETPTPARAVWFQGTDQWLFPIKIRQTWHIDLRFLQNHLSTFNGIYITLASLVPKGKVTVYPYQ